MRIGFNGRWTNREGQCVHAQIMSFLFKSIVICRADWCAFEWNDDSDNDHHDERRNES